VLKLFKEWADSSWAEREFTACRLAYEAGVPVPRPYEMLEHEGRIGILFERVEGVTAVRIFRTQPWRVFEITREMANLQAIYLQAPGSGLGSNKASLEWVIRRVIEKGLPGGRGERALAVLAALPDGDRLCHMDFHADNLMLTNKGWVILDWMNARSGPPLADVARTNLIFRVGVSPERTVGGRVITWMVRLATWNNLRVVRNRLGFTQVDLDAWILPVATARLWENIPGERERILPIIDDLLEKGI
jgi:aminoglycoside phosphotransferase (APT) family kinase protein